MIWEGEENLSNSDLELHVISSHQMYSPSEISCFAQIWPYVTSLHLRKKEGSVGEIQYMLSQLQAIGVPMNKITLNRQKELAAKYQTGALHVGIREVESRFGFSSLYKGKETHTEDMKVKRLGVSVHSHEEARLAEKYGADYVFYGHMYPSASKPGIPPKTINSLREVCEGLTLPVIAIGGITPERVKELILTGASGIAVISGVLNSPEPLEAVLRYRNELSNFGNIK